MRWCGGTEDPRRWVGEGGCAVRCAQSRGEWPGDRRTFLLRREGGGRVDVESKAEVGGGRRRGVVVGVGWRREGGGLRVGCGFLGLRAEVGVFRLALGGGRGGGGIVEIGGSGLGSGGGDGDGSIDTTIRGMWSPFVKIFSDTSPAPPPSKAKDGTTGEPFKPPCVTSFAAIPPFPIFSPPFLTNNNPFSHKHLFSVDAKKRLYTRKESDAARMLIPRYIAAPQRIYVRSTERGTE